MNPWEVEKGIVYLRRKTLPEQVEYLLIQLAVTISEVNRLKDENQALELAVKSLENRLEVVERVTPLKGPSNTPRR